MKLSKIKKSKRGRATHGSISKPWSLRTNSKDLDEFDRLVSAFGLSRSGAVNAFISAVISDPDNDPVDDDYDPVDDDDYDTDYEKHCDDRPSLRALRGRFYD